MHHIPKLLEEGLEGQKQTKKKKSLGITITNLLGGFVDGILDKNA